MDRIKEFISTYRYYLLGGLGVIALLGVLWYVFRSDLSGQIAIPYIAHQQPRVDPHLPDAVDLSDKLDEVLFDGLFNISANPSGIVYEDALGELIDFNPSTNIVAVRLNTKKKWHSSYTVTAEDDEVTIADKSDVYFSAEDVLFSLNRIRRLGSLSPEYIVVSQALANWEFEGPDNNNEIRFRFKGDRLWSEDEIKEVLAFKVLPRNSDIAATNYSIGSGPYLSVPGQTEVRNYYRSPDGVANIPAVNLLPFVDNSTYTTELKNGNFNVLLNTPFGSLSPVLEDAKEFFVKSNISTTFFCILLNTERLNIDQRREVRNLINNKTLIERFYKVNTPQQRNIVDYKGNRNNYDDYLNYSVFPSSTYYVEEELVIPVKARSQANTSILPDSLRIVASLNYGHREEYAELLEIMNDPGLFQGRIRALAVDNSEIQRGNYDGILLAIDGYKSTFMFDLYNLFLREADMETHKINLVTAKDAKGENIADPRSLNGTNNFCRLNAGGGGAEQADVLKFLEYMHGFMYTNQLGDRQFYAGYVADLEEKLSLGVWLFSLPSLAYFGEQFEDGSIQLYGTASQLSTIEKWREREDD